MSSLTNNVILDFSANIDIDWEPIDDRIMGGASQSQPEYINGMGLRFSGHVSLENNGGFASIRSATGNFDLTHYNGLKLLVRGDGKRYKISLRTDYFYDGISYQTSFPTEKNTWEEMALPFDAFLPTHHGIKLSTVAPLDTASIRTFGFFIADKQVGPFQLDIARIEGF